MQTQDNVKAATLPKYPVIARVQPGTKQTDVWAGSIDLFLPYDPANHGHLVVYAKIGQHSEASLPYYWTTRKPRTPKEKEAAAQALREYRAYIASIPAEHQCKLVERVRLPHDFRKHAWA